MWYYKIPPTSNIWTLPFFLLLAMVTALGIGLWLSALNVLYRDIGYIIPFLTQLWFYLTPIVYSASEVPEQWQTLYALNPMVGVVEGFRWAILGTSASPGPTVAVSSVVALLMLITGMFYFRRMERTFADMV
jgi:lipopolysaccharide transport system permease protein